MSSSTTTYPPLQPGTVIAGLTIEPSGTIWWQWLTFFIFGNLFAGAWLVLAFLNAHPDVKYKIESFLIKVGLKRPHSSKYGRSSSSAAQSGQRQSLELSEQHTQQQQQVLQCTPTGGALQNPNHSRVLGPEQLSSPLRSHRSKPTPPPQLCMEQTITPRGSLPLSPNNSVGLASKASGAVGATAAGIPAAASMANNHGTYTVPEGTEGTCSATVADAQDQQQEDDSGESMYTDGSYDEPRYVRLEWRNLCFAVKAATGLRLIVQVRVSGSSCSGPGQILGRAFLTLRIGIDLAPIAFHDKSL